MKPPRPLLLLLFIAILTPGRAAALTFEVDGGKVRALDGAQLLWENRHDRAHVMQSDEARRKRVQRGSHRRAVTGSRRHPGQLLGPVVAGESVFYAVGGSLYEVHARTGVVRSRRLLSGACEKLEVVKDEVLVRLRAYYMKQTWTRTFTVRPGARGGIPFFLPDSLLGIRLARSDADHVATDVRLALESAASKKAKNGRRRRKRVDPKESTRAAIKELERLGAWDRTNPWYSYHRGELLEKLGRKQEAARAFQGVLACDPDHEYELLAISTPLVVKEPALSQAAFARGVRFLRARGYEPEMFFSLISLAFVYGSPPQEVKSLDRLASIDLFDRLGERIWDLAPYCEGAYAMFQGLADASRQAGRAEAAARWESRARKALRSPAMLGGFKAIERGGLGFTAAAALSLAALVYLVVTVLVCWGTLARDERPFLLKLLLLCRYWTKGQILGFLLLTLLSWLVVLPTVEGIAAITGAARWPVSSWSGNLGSPGGIEYLEKFGGNPAGDALRALARQQAGDLDAALKIYETLDTPRALVNRGVILHARGDAAGARRLFEEALASDPTLVEAAHNLGQKVDAPRVDRARRYGLEGPLLALPTERDWWEALRRTPLAGGEVRELNASAVFSFADPMRWAGTLFTMLALVALFLPRWGAAARPGGAGALAGLFLGLLFPGTSRRYGLAGALLLAAFVFLVLCAWSLHASNGAAADPVSAIVIVGAGGAYGIAGSLWPPLSSAVRTAASLWWLLPALNALLLVALARWRSEGPLS